MDADFVAIVCRGDGRATASFPTRAAALASSRLRLFARINPRSSFRLRREFFIALPGPGGKAAPRVDSPGAGSAPRDAVKVFSTFPWRSPPAAARRGLAADCPGWCSRRCWRVLDPRPPPERVAADPPATADVGRRLFYVAGVHQTTGNCWLVPPAIKQVKHQFRRRLADPRRGAPSRASSVRRGARLFIRCVVLLRRAEGSEAMTSLVPRGTRCDGRSPVHINRRSCGW